MIKTIIFDLGGVILTLDQPQAISRFKQLGIADALLRLDPYKQGGIFGALEEGRIDAEAFRREASQLAGRELTADECRWAWLGYAKEVPQRNLDVLQQLRRQGYRLVLLSNTNPYMMSWVMSPEFDGQGHGLDHYLDACYLSYKLGVMKPSAEFFDRVLAAEQARPDECLFVDDGQPNVDAAARLGIHTYCPANGQDWTSEIYEYLNEI